MLSTGQFCGVVCPKAAYLAVVVSVVLDGFVWYDWNVVELRTTLLGRFRKKGGKAKASYLQG